MPIGEEIEERARVEMLFRFYSTGDVDDKA